MTYLDTNVTIWLRRGDKHALPKRARQAFDADDELLISPMVLLELELLHEIGRLKYPADEIAEQLSSLVGIHVCNYPFALITEHALHEKWTRDPFDRIIVAHAHSRNAPLITHDEEIRRYYDRAVW
jgi:PIN domain nuclease of toxin-antitoxin system